MCLVNDRKILNSNELWDKQNDIGWRAKTQQNLGNFFGCFFKIKVKEETTEQTNKKNATKFRKVFGFLFKIKNKNKEGDNREQKVYKFYDQNNLPQNKVEENERKTKTKFWFHIYLCIILSNTKKK